MLESGLVMVPSIHDQGLPTAEQGYPASWLSTALHVLWSPVQCSMYISFIKIPIIIFKDHLLANGALRIVQN